MFSRLELSRGSIPQTECPNKHFFTPEEAKRLMELCGFGLNRMMPPINKRSFRLCAGNTLRATISVPCFGSILQRCSMPECVEGAEGVRRSIPPCDWEPFREWMITTISCWRSTASMPGGLAKPTSLLDPYNVQSIIKFVLKQWGALLGTEWKTPCIDIVGILSVLDWAASIVRLPPREYRSHLSLLCGVYESFIFQRISDFENDGVVRRLGICQSRIWNLLVSADNQPLDLVAILSGLRQPGFIEQQGGSKHEDCTAQLCHFADDNTTKVAQMHSKKCESSLHTRILRGECSKANFPPDDLRKVIKSAKSGWVCTAWDIRERSKARSRSIPSTTPILASPSLRYIAISHVWSDGTGVGLNELGTVNSCLVAYFAKIAQRLGCDGVWWDAICIPSGIEERRRALDRMLENYTNAAYVVIHDRELANFEWKDDGTPAVAVVLSTWFTRCWTAAELFSSGRGKGGVRVIFKDPKSSEPLLMDLETEILAPLGSHSDSREHYSRGHAHLAASRIVHAVWAKEKNSMARSLPDLMSILQPRATSRKRDRVLVAALLCVDSEDLDTSHSPMNLTQDIMCTIMKFPADYLYHGEATMCKSGPFSWCPPSIFDLGQTMISMAPYWRGGEQKSEREKQISVDAPGIISGSFDVFTLPESDCATVFPYGSHPAVLGAIRVALSAPGKCV